MLFDLSSPGRKRVIRVVYAVLAFLFFIGFVGFGIGTDQGIGGLFDSITGNGGDSSTAGQYEQQIEDAEDKLEEDPTNERALKDLVQYRYGSGAAQLEIDESTGQPTGLTDESRDEFEAAIEAWNRYVETDPAKVDLTTATNVVQAYQLLGDYGGAAEAQALLVKANPSASDYGRLAFFYYADLNFKKGDEAADKAVAEAKPALKKQTEKQLSQLRESAQKFQKQQEKLSNSATGESELQTPFGGLDQSGQGLPPTAP
jgi:tetratricopeptide (TPR) repeat protein